MRTSPIGIVPILLERRSTRPRATKHRVVGEATDFDALFDLVLKGMFDASLVEAEPTCSTATGHKILVAEDEDELRSFLVETLSVLGNDVLGVRDGHEALRAIESRANFDLVVSDLKMPGLDGLEVLRRLRHQRNNIEFILLTAFGSIDGAVEAMKLGAFDYLQKPLESPGALRRVAREALQRRALRARASAETSATIDAPDTSATHKISTGVKPRRNGIGSMGIGSMGSEPCGIRLAFRSEIMLEVEETLRRAAASPSTILLLGESGVGKEVAAHAIHAWSPRAHQNFAAVNCAGLLDGILENELFGHERGAFTGAQERRSGRLEAAHGGSFFLDEIGEMRPEIQARFLRVLETKSFSPIGSTREVQVDIRWIAATNVDLEEAVAQGIFRADLFHRISVFPVRIPPLRERREDIAPLAETLLDRIREFTSRPALALSEAALEFLEQYDFPGNIRELSNMLERASILAMNDVIGIAELEYRRERRVAPKPRFSSGGPISMAEAEKKAILKALEASGGNRRDAASTLGIGLRTLYDKLRKYRLPAQ